MNGQFNSSVEKFGLYESKHTDGDAVKEHYHQVYQILYVLEGSGKVSLNKETFDISQDNVVITVPYSKHSIISETKLTVLVLEFEEAVLDVTVRNSLLHHFFNSPNLLTLHLFDAGEVRQLLRKMLYEQSNGSVINKLAMKIFLSELLLIFARAQKDTQLLDANNLRAERLRNYIDTHYFEMMSSDDIAAKLGMSVRHINNIFKEQYSVTPLQYLTEVRVELAKKMLIETDKAIVSICFEVGFESLSTFYRTFKNATRISPNKYRTAHIQHDVTVDAL